MSCCGKSIKKDLTEKALKVKNIATGQVLSLFQGESTTPQHAKERLAICKRCDELTWFTRSEYWAWLKENKIDVLKNIEDLTVLPPLVKKPFIEKEAMYCRLCKCYLPAKAIVKTEKCPEGKW
jgi:hypothetical protein